MVCTSPARRSRAHSTARSRWLAWSHSGGRRSRATQTAAAATRAAKTPASNTQGRCRTSIIRPPSGAEVGANQGDPRSHLVGAEPPGLMGDGPDGHSRGGVVGTTGDEVPVDVGDRVAEQLVVHLDGAER